MSRLNVFMPASYHLERKRNGRYVYSMSVVENRRFPPPWKVVEHEESYSVIDAHGFPFCYLYFEARGIVGTSREKLTKDQARRLASNIAKLPELLKSQPPPASG